MASYLWEFDDSSMYYLNKTEILLKQHDAVFQWRERNRQFLIRGQMLPDRVFGANIDGWAMARVGLAVGASLIFKTPALATRFMAISSPPHDLVAALQSLHHLIDEGLRLMTTKENHVG
jgi:hypothetical protein